MNKLTKTIRIIMLAGLLSGFFFSFTAFAQENLQSTLKEVSEKSDKIETIKENHELSNEERALLDIQVRKDVVLKTLELTVLEDTDLQNKLNAITNLSESELAVRNYLLKLLEENKKVYEMIRERLDGADTVKEIKSLANDFKNWRSLSYNQKVENMVSFISVFQQKKILKTAESRLQIIEEGINKLKELGILENKVGNLFQKSSEAINDAKIANNKALETVLQIINNEISPKDGGFIKNIVSFGKKMVTQITVKKLVNDSMQQVREAYKLFSQISDLVSEK